MPSSRHVPLRTCVLCGDKRPKRELLRIVKQSEGALSIDEVGKAPGRGCYVCLRAANFDRRRISDKIKGALKLNRGVPSEFIEELSAKFHAEKHRNQ